MAISVLLARDGSARRLPPPPPSLKSMATRSTNASGPALVPAHGTAAALRL